MGHVLERGTQTHIRDCPEFHMRGFARGRWPCCVRYEDLPRRQWRLHQPQLGHGPVAEVSVDALDELTPTVLHVERAPGVDAQDERGTGPAALLSPSLIINARLARPFEPLRLGLLGHIRADDGSPIGQQGCSRETVLCESSPSEAGNEGAD